ncbi:MAG TPA: lamin tail domain-containing protein [Acidimicrobiia bacterium]|jgi:endonuclease YncB( thermonuclease family)
MVGGGGDPASPTSNVPFETVLVASVIDGDSFQTELQDFRLFGINAPELGECFGEESHQWLSDWIANKEVAVSPRAVDQFGRIVADVWVGPTPIGEEATSSGHAFGLTDTRVTLVEGEIRAMQAALGLWGDDICGANVPKVELIIDEVDFDPPGRDEFERVVIRNGSLEEIDLGGFVLRDESSVNRFRFPSIALSPGESIAITNGCPIGANGLGWCANGPVWNNNGDAVIVLDQFGRVVAIHRY